MTSSSITLAQAACQIALDLSPAILPKTTLTAQANPGDTTLSVADVRPFLSNTILSFWDGTTEAPLAVKSSTPSGQSQAPSLVPGTVTLDFAGQTYSGLQETHLQGATVATNILDTLPGKTAGMLKNGWPVLSIFVLDRAERHGALANLWQGHPVLSLCYQLPGNPDSRNPLHSQLWLRQTHHRAENDISAFVQALEQNITINPGTGATAMSILSFVRAFRQNLDQKPDPTFELYLDVVITGLIGSTT